MSARRLLGTINTVGYFDVFKKSDLIRVLPDTVMKDIRRSLVIKLETTNYQELLDIVQQIITDHSGQDMPMNLNAVDTTSKDVEGKGKGHGQGGGTYLEGDWSFCGTYGHKRADCNNFTSQHISKVKG